MFTTVKIDGLKIKFIVRLTLPVVCFVAL